MADAHPVLMPKLGQTVEESTIVKWNKKEGDAVAKGEVLFEIETDKAVLEAESFVEGTLLKILVPEGKSVPVQATVAFVGNEGDNIPEVAPPPPPPAKKAEPKPEPKKTTAPAQKTEAAPQATASAAPVAAPVPSAPQRFKISPRARKLASDKVIHPEKISGTGPSGRVIEKDVVAYLEENKYDEIRITPTAKNLAAEEKLDLFEIYGSGEGGRITMDDVKMAVREKPQAMSKMRQVIAQRLTQSFATIPHFFVTQSIDMTDLLAFRKQLKEAGAPFSVTDFILEAVTLSLKEFDAMNSMTPDGIHVKWNAKVHLGLAVSIENGLVVPVIKAADDLSLSELHDKAAELSKKARDGKLSPDEMKGSTFTISNMGMLGVEQFNAIINPGEGAILAVASTIKTPVVKDGEIKVRDIMKITLSADHRIIDGALGASFVNAVKDKLEDVELWKRIV